MPETDPIGLPSRNNQMRTPAIYKSVQRVVLVNTELGREPYGTARAIVQAVFAIDIWISLRK